jgi:monofunctional biosynthetic peptidoglycan transglycosylase
MGFMIAGITFLIRIAAVAIFTTSAHPARAAATFEPVRVTDLQQKMLTFVGGQGALGKVRTLAFDFRVRSGEGDGLLFQHAYDRQRGVYRYECSCADFARVPVWDETADDRWQPAPDPPEGNRLVAVYRFPELDGTVYIDGKSLREPDNSRILRRVHSRVMNERAWMFLPFFLSSPRLRAVRVEPVTDPEWGKLHGFEGFWGEKRGDSDVWTAYLGPDGELVRSDFRLKHSLERSTTAIWRDWRWYGPVRIAGERLMPESGRRLIFERIKVNEGVSFAESLYEPDTRAPSGETDMGDTASSIVVFDFDDPKKAREWRTVNDTVMGGVSQSQFAITHTGTGLFQGTVSLEHSGGFASVRSPAGSHDLSAHEGVELRVKGDGKRYKLSLATDSRFDAVMYQAGFETEQDAWRVVRLPFSSFVPTYHGRTLTDAPPIDRGHILSFGFLVADRQEGAFRLEVDSVKAY